MSHAECRRWRCLQKHFNPKHVWRGGPVVKKEKAFFGDGHTNTTRTKEKVDGESFPRTYYDLFLFFFFFIVMNEKRNKSREAADRTHLLSRTEGWGFINLLRRHLQPEWTATTWLLTCASTRSSTGLSACSSVMLGFVVGLQQVAVGKLPNMAALGSSRVPPAVPG